MTTQTGSDLNPFNHGYAVTLGSSYTWAATLTAAEEMARRAPGAVVAPARRPGMQLDAQGGAL